MKGVSMVFLVAAFVLWAGAAYAAHPLVTDDTGTQGKGKFQLEVNGEVSFDEETSDGVTVEETASELAAALSYGVAENTDIVVGVPYQWIRTEEDGDEADEDGVSDVSVELKWRFYEKDGLSFAVKPGLTLPTGDDEKGLGAGRATYGAFAIATKDLSPATLHVNIGYTRSENTAEEREDIWHASVAGELAATGKLTAVANVGVETNPDPASGTPPAFALAGLIYSLGDNLSVDAGVKVGLSKPEADVTVLAGMAYTF